MSRDVICATCEWFSLKDSPQAADGIGRCSGYDGHKGPIEPLVRWDKKFTVLYSPAPDMVARLAWIKRQKEREASANAAATE